MEGWESQRRVNIGKLFTVNFRSESFEGEISFAIAITLTTLQIAVKYQAEIRGHLCTRCDLLLLYLFSGPVFWSHMSFLLIIFEGGGCFFSYGVQKYGTLCNGVSKEFESGTNIYSGSNAQNLICHSG